MKKIISIILALALVLCAAVSVHAEGGSNAEVVEGAVASGYCGAEGDGTNLIWALDAEGTLTISGKGAMQKHNYYADYGRISWNDPFEGQKLADKIKKVVIEEGVTTIGDAVFFDCVNLTEVTLPDSLTEIRSRAFEKTSIKSITIPSSVTSIGACTMWGNTEFINIFSDGADVTIYGVKGSCAEEYANKWGYEFKTVSSSDGSSSSNPKTGVVLSVLPLVAALAAVAFKKR